MIVKDGEFLNFLTNQEKRIDKIYKKFVDLRTCPKKHEDI